MSQDNNQTNQKDTKYSYMKSMQREQFIYLSYKDIKEIKSFDLDQQFG